MNRSCLLLLAAVVAACRAQPEATAIAPLVKNDSAGNAAKAARLIAQQCFGRADSLAKFEAALKASGWPTTRTQTADPNKPLEVDVWSLPTGTLIRGQLVRGAVWVCSLSANGPFSPDISDMRSALTQVAGSQPGKMGGWWWNSGSHRFHMDLEAQRDGSLFINVEDYRLPWWRSILG